MLTRVDYIVILFKKKKYHLEFVFDQTIFLHVIWIALRLSNSTRLHRVNPHVI